MLYSFLLNVYIYNKYPVYISKLVSDLTNIETVKHGECLNTSVS